MNQRVTDILNYLDQDEPKTDASQDATPEIGRAHV